MRLFGKTAIITGGAGLIGPAYMHALLKEGAYVLLADNNLSALEALYETLNEAQKVKVHYLKMNVESSSDWHLLRDYAMEKWEKVDVLINNAAITNQSKSKAYEKNFFDYPLDDWNAIMDVNLSGTFLGCQIIGKVMVEAGSGSIINIASFYGIQSPNHKMYPGTGIFQPPAYMVSKAGVIALTRYLATYLGETGVRVNCISPGGVFNNHKELFLERFSSLNPMGRMANKEEMSGAVVYLASDESSYCTGHNMVIDGGWSAW